MPKTWPRALLFYLSFFDLRTQFGVPKGVTAERYKRCKVLG